MSHRIVKLTLVLGHIEPKIEWRKPVSRKAQDKRIDREADEWIELFTGTIPWPIYDRVLEKLGLHRH